MSATEQAAIEMPMVSPDDSVECDVTVELRMSEAVMGEDDMEIVLVGVVLGLAELDTGVVVGVGEEETVGVLEVLDEKDTNVAEGVTVEETVEVSDGGPDAVRDGDCEVLPVLDDDPVKLIDDEGVAVKLLDTDSVGEVEGGAESDGDNDEEREADDDTLGDGDTLPVPLGDVNGEIVSVGVRVTLPETVTVEAAVVEPDSEAVEDCVALNDVDTVPVTLAVGVTLGEVDELADELSVDDVDAELEAVPVALVDAVALCVVETLDDDDDELDVVSDAVVEGEKVMEPLVVTDGLTVVDSEGEAVEVSVAVTDCDKQCPNNAREMAKTMSVLLTPAMLESIEPARLFRKGWV